MHLQTAMAQCAEYTFAVQQILVATASTVPISLPHSPALLLCTTLHCTVQCTDSLHCTVLYNALIHCTEQYCTLHCFTALHGSSLCCSTALISSDFLHPEVSAGRCSHTRPLEGAAAQPAILRASSQARLFT